MWKCSRDVLKWYGNQTNNCFNKSELVGYILETESAATTSDNIIWWNSTSGLNDVMPGDT